MLSSQRINHVIEHGACLLGFRPRVEACGRFQPFVPKDLPHYFIITRLLVEERLSGKMPEQVNVERKAGKLKDGLFNLQAKRMAGLVVAITSREQRISWFTDQIWPILGHVPAQNTQGMFRDVKIHRVPVFGLAFANDQMDALALRLQVSVNVDRTHICNPDRYCL